MKATHYGLTAIIGLLLSFAISAEAVPAKFVKSWGDGTLESTENGVLQYVTDGKGEPDFIDAPLNLVDFKGKSIIFDIKIDEVNNYSGIEIRLGDDGFDNYYALEIPRFEDPEFNILQSKYWQTCSFGVANASVVGHPEHKVTRIGIYMQDNGHGPLKVALTNIRVVAAQSKGYVSLTFDDGYVSQYDAAEIMYKHGFAGTAYVMPREIGEPGYLTLNQVKDLKDKYHWGISSHNALSYTDFGRSKLAQEIDYTISYLASNGFSSSASHLAYPMGKQERNVVLPIVREHFLTARLAGGGVETLPPADWYLLRSVNVLDSTPPEELVDVVEQAVNNGEWAILMFHYLVDNPQRPTEYSKEEFEKFIELLDKANVPVLPVDQVYQHFKDARRTAR